MSLNPRLATEPLARPCSSPRSQSQTPSASPSDRAARSAVDRPAISPAATRCGGGVGAPLAVLAPSTTRDGGST